MGTAVDAFCRAVTRAEATVLKVEMTDECKKEIISGRQKLIDAETRLLASHRSEVFQQLRTHNEEFASFVKSGKAVYLSPKIF